jgi:hypothetical protein
MDEGDAMAKQDSGISSLRTMYTFLNGRACSDTLFHILNREFGRPMPDEEHAVMPMAGGIMQHGYQCGMIWGATLAAGAQAHRLFGPGPLAETRSIIAARGIVDAFRALTNEINCFEITDIDNKSSTMKMLYVFLIKGKTIGCIRMSARYAPIAFNAIDSAFSRTDIDVPDPPVSCAAILAQKMGASEMHTVMASGLAGGIGLCGGACGALGAAIWITGMRRSKQPNRKTAFKDPASMRVVERFLKQTKYRFECSEITGRKFENPAEHAAFLREGGCKEVIEVLAAIR